MGTGKEMTHTKINVSRSRVIRWKCVKGNLPSDDGQTTDDG